MNKKNRISYTFFKFLWRSFKAKNRDHKTEIKELGKVLKHGDIAIDIGANKGSFTHSLSRFVGKTGTVFAFEPQKVLFNYLKDMCRSNVVVKSTPLSNKRKSAEFFIPANGDSPGATLVKGDHIPNGWIPVKVSTDSLDSILKDIKKPIKAIKIDVEGHELEVLKGANCILEKNKPLIVVECEQRHLIGRKIEEVFEWIISMGYTGKFVCNNKLIPLDEFNLIKHQNSEGDRYWDKKDYCNNFIFYGIDLNN